MSVDVHPIRAFVRASVVAFLAVVALGLAVGAVTTAPQVYDCFRNQHKNNPPVAWSGVVICAPERADPPTEADMAELLECLDEMEVEYDTRALPQWRYYSVDDIIPYPLPLRQVAVGFSNPLRRTIFVRSDLSPAMYHRVQMHETVHALRGPGHDPAYIICTGV